MPEPSNASPEDRFADALDAITLGLEWRDNQVPLAVTAQSIDAIGLDPNGFHDDEPVTLDRAAKRRIWADLLREHGAGTTPESTPEAPGTAGSTLSPNPWVSPEPTRAKRPRLLRPSTGVLRFVPAPQPASTFLLVIAAVVLVGGAFASLAPNGNGVFTNASATENPAQLAYASPEASPAADACTAGTRGDGTGETLPERLYRGGGYVPELHEIYVSNRWAEIVTCGPFDGAAGEIPVSMMTDRLAATYPETGSEGGAWIVTEDEARAILGSPPAWHELEEMERMYTGAISANRDFRGDPLALNADLGVYRGLADGRVAFYSGAWWLAVDDRIDPVIDPAETRVTIHIFAQQDRQWLYDESLELCLGTCDEFQTSGVPKPQLTIATPNAAYRQWLAPVTDAACVFSTPELSAAPPTAPAIETDPADYLPFGTADEADQEAAAITYLRLSSGCEDNDDRPLVPESAGAILGSPGETGITQSQIDTARAISDALGYTDPIEIMIANEEAVEITDEDGFTYIQKYFVLLPEDVVQLPDGRLGGMLRIQQDSNVPGAWAQDFPATTLFVTFERISGQWALAESFVVCVGQCQDFWTETLMTMPASATPAARPTARLIAARR